MTNETEAGGDEAGRWAAAVATPVTAVHFVDVVTTIGGPKGRKVVAVSTKSTQEAAVAEGTVAQGAGVSFAAQMPVGAARGRFLLLSGWEEMGMAAAGRG